MAEAETFTRRRYEAAAGIASAHAPSMSDPTYALRAVIAGQLDQQSSLLSYRRLGKRLLDVSLGLILLLVLAPVILTAAVLMALVSGWPAFYPARRLGKDGHEFSVWKIRTMVKDADRVLKVWQSTGSPLADEYEANCKLVNDPRITRLGGFLRRTSIDELPQLWNVLRGDMSLVGPRPYYPWELEAHPTTRLALASVRPGLTGPWQVQGRNGLTPEVRRRLDEDYVRGYSLGADVGYLVRTVRVLLRADGI